MPNSTFRLLLEPTPLGNYDLDSLEGWVQAILETARVTYAETGKLDDIHIPPAHLLYLKEAYLERISRTL